MTTSKTTSLLKLLAHPEDSVALQDDKQVIRYGQLQDAIAERAQQLAEVSVLGLAMDNSVEWVLWDLAALESGTICVPIPPFFTTGQVTHTIQSAGISHLLNQNGLRPTQAQAVNAIPSGTSKITYTSGTTNEPKGVCLSTEAMLRVANSIVEVLGPDFVGRHACVLPLAVLLENIAGIYAPLIAGCSIKLKPLQQLGQHYEQLHPYLKESCATSVILVPEILRSLMQQVAMRSSLPDLRFVAVGGSKVNPELLRQAQQLGLPVYEGYGLSECGSVVALNTPTTQRLGSVGKILPHIKAKIVEDEIIITDPGFLGYLNEPASPEFATGDLGQLDEDGYLSITGRKKNVLITSYGRNISPEWIESLLLSDPEIYQTLVFGDGKAYLSALVVPVKKDITLDPIIENINQQLPEYAQIQQTYIVEPFTLTNKQLTGTGRPRRNIILEKYASLNPINDQSFQQVPL